MLKIEESTNLVLILAETFVCAHSTCGKVFISQSDLQKHMKMHLGQKDFVCDVEGCGKEYTTIHHLKVCKFKGNAQFLLNVNVNINVKKPQIYFFEAESPKVRKK